MSKFPRFGLIDLLLVLTKIGFGTDTKMESEWKPLTRHKTEEHKYICDWIHIDKNWKIGKSGLVNEWITFYIYLCLKYKEDFNN